MRDLMNMESERLEGKGLPPLVLRPPETCRIRKNGRSTVAVEPWKGRPARRKLFSFEELLSEPDPKWLIEGVLPQGFAELYAAPKTKKTFVAIDMALTVASQEGDWFGRAVKHGPVVYVCAEGFTGIKKRMRAWVDAKGGGENPDRISIHKGPVDMSKPATVKEFITGIRAKGPDPVLIVIDTLARCFGDGDENNAADMGTFIRHCDLLQAEFPGCTVLVLHHTGKDANKGGRGSSSLRGALEVGMTIEQRGDGFNLKCKDMKDSEEFEDIPLKLVPQGESAVVQFGVSTTRKAKPGVEAAKLTDSHRKVMKALEGGAITWTGIANHARINGSTVTRALDDLIPLGRVRKRDDGLYELVLDNTHARAMSVHARPHPYRGGAVRVGRG